jgi:hypothetical protein
MLGSAVTIDRVLPAAHELSLPAFDELGLVESEPLRPGPGVDWRAFHAAANVAQISSFRHPRYLVPEVTIVAVDWSGRSSGPAESIWLARTDGEGQLVQLENGRDRDTLVDHLLELAARTPRLVVGLDFAFGFPAWWSAHNGWASGHEIWQAMSAMEPQLLAACEPPFWGRPNHPNPNTPARGLRVTDLGSHPAKSVFQIGGAGSVGTGSIRGMTQLARLSAAGFAIWPFDDDDGTRPVAIEIYPRRLTGPVNKSSWRARHAHLSTQHPNQPDRMRERAAGSQDAFDAAISAIVMSRHHDQLTHLPTVTHATTRLEGCIWAPSGAAHR